MLVFSLCGCEAVKKAQEPMTEEEYSQYLANRYEHYEVLSVFQYVETHTNIYGGVTGTSVCYSFTYLDGNDNLKTINSFEHLEYGLTRVCVGEVDEYVVDTIEDIRYLYLSKETLNKLTGSAN